MQLGMCALGLQANAATATTDAGPLANAPGHKQCPRAATQQRGMHWAALLPCSARAVAGPRTGDQNTG